MQHQKGARQHHRADQRPVRPWEAVANTSKPCTQRSVLLPGTCMPSQQVSVDRTRSMSAEAASTPVAQAKKPRRA